MEQTAIEKRCSACKEVKAVTEFRKNRAQRDGLHNQCKPCTSAYKRKWRKDNPDRHREAQRKWREANPERHLAYVRNWQEANRELYLTGMRDRFSSRIGTRDPAKPWPDGWCSYGAAHIRVKYTRGYASAHSCVDCGGGAEEWSYNHAADQEFTQTIKMGFGTDRTKEVGYSGDPGDYDPRCKSCHISFDKQNA